MRKKGEVKSLSPGRTAAGRKGSFDSERGVGFTKTFKASPGELEQA